MEDNSEETAPLLGSTSRRSPRCQLMTRHRTVILLTSFSILIFILIAVVQQLYFIPPTPPDIPTKDKIDLSLFSLSVWGSPASFGVLDKEARIEAIGEYLSTQRYDVVLLQELWMRPDHETIRSHLPAGYWMSKVGDLAPSDICDGRVAPSFCSGLALVTNLPVKDFSFTPFSVHGSIWNNDGEFWARKGVGRVRLEPALNLTVDIFLSSLCADDSNTYYRQIQATEFGEALRNSDADFVLAGGNFEVDPRTSETSYGDISRGMLDTKSVYFGDSWLNSNLATYGNIHNSYSRQYSPLVYDYFLHKAANTNKIVVKKVEIPILKMKSGKSLSNHEASVAGYTLIKTK